MVGAGVEGSDTLDIACKIYFFLILKILMIVQSFSDKVNIQEVQLEATLLKLIIPIEII
jgi:hypothetical protein